MKLFGLLSILVFVVLVASAQNPLVAKAENPLEENISTNYYEAKRDPFRGEFKVVKPDVKPPATLYALPIPSFAERDNAWRKARDEAKRRGAIEPAIATRYLIDELQIVGLYKKPEGIGIMIKPTPTNTTLFVSVGEKFYNGTLMRVEGKEAIFREEIRLSNGKTKFEERSLYFDPKRRSN